MNDIYKKNFQIDAAVINNVYNMNIMHVLKKRLLYTMYSIEIPFIFKNKQYLLLSIELAILTQFCLSFFFYSYLINEYLFFLFKKGYISIDNDKTNKQYFF